MCLENGGQEEFIKEPMEIDPIRFINSLPVNVVLPITIKSCRFKLTNWIK